MQIAVLGTLCALMAVLADGAYALPTSRFRTNLDRKERDDAYLRHLEGAVYIGLRARTALAERRQGIVDRLTHRPRLHA